MQTFIEQYYIALAWVTALGTGFFIVRLFTHVWKRLRQRARLTAFRKPKPGQNPVYDFVQDWCERTPGAKTYASELYDAYRVWCGDNENKLTSRHVFGCRLSQMGLERKKSQWIVYRDIELNSKARRRMAAENKTSC